MDSLCYRLRSTQAVILFSLGLFACQQAPKGSIKEGAILAAERIIDRDKFFEDEENTVKESADVIRKDPKIKTLSENLKADPFYGCGYKGLDAGDTLEIDATQLKNDVTKIVNSRATILGKANTRLGGLPQDFYIDNIFTVSSASPNNALQAANETAMKFSTRNTIAAISQAEIQDAVAAPSDKPLCGFVFASEQKAISADNATFVNASFDKPIPQIINPKLSVERIKFQLIEPIKISDITATLSTNDGDVSDTGLTHRGEIEVTLIPPNRSLSDSTGKTIRITAEVAYRITSKFVGSEQQDGQTSVLDRVMEFYISRNKIVNMVVRAPRPELPLIIYSAE